MPNQDNQLKNFAKFSGLGFQMLAIIGVSTFLGTKLDSFFSNSITQYYTLGLSLAGVVLAIIFTLKQILKDSNNSNNQE